MNGLERCIIAGKYPSMVENLSIIGGFLYLRFWVKLLSSIARINPVKVTNKAVILRCRGMVI